MRLQQRFASHHTAKSSNSHYNTKAKNTMVPYLQSTVHTLQITATSASRNVTEGTGERNSEGREKNEKNEKKDRSFTRGTEGAKEKGKKGERRRGGKKIKFLPSGV